MADTFFWGSDIISRATRWLLINTGTTFNLLVPLLLILLGLALGQIHSSDYLSCLLLIIFLYLLFSIFVLIIDFLQFSGGILFCTWCGGSL